MVRKRGVTAARANETVVGDLSSISTIAADSTLHTDNTLLGSEDGDTTLNGTRTETSTPLVDAAAAARAKLPEGCVEALLGGAEPIPLTAAARRRTFPGRWPHGARAKCNPNSLAEAGFVYIGNRDSPDAVQCFVCFKELEGFEPSDVPWTEHADHSGACPFALLRKKDDELTTGDILSCLAYRNQRHLQRSFESEIVEPFKTGVAAADEALLLQIGRKS